ncbi:MAG: hypothetical protein ACR2HY_04320 [Acidimicrobiales bacterium]
MLGIVSIGFNLVYIPGILAIVWGGRERQENSKARTGFICGIHRNRPVGPGHSC